jgi:predicted esterase
MAQEPKMDKPRIFISHAWEDKALVRRLEKTLADAGAQVWVDHAGIRGGDNLPERINDALERCNTLLLVWSKAAKSSHWVKLEWTNAISLRKLIIPFWRLQ